MILLWTIAKREILDNLMSLKFFFGTVLCLVLIIISTAISMHDYQNRMNDYESAVADFGKSLYSNVYHPRLYRKPEVLGIFARGLDRHFGNVAKMDAIRMGPVLATGFMGTAANLQFSAEFASIDFLFVVRVILSLLAIFLSYDTISGEYERGTLKLMLSHPVSRASILLGKAMAGCVCLLIPLVMSFIVGIVIAQLVGDIEFTSEEWLRISLVFGITVLCLMSFYMIGLVVSSRTHHASTSLVILLLIWIAGVFLVPGIAKTAVGRYRLVMHSPAKDIYAIQADFFRRAKEEHVPNRRQEPEAYARYEAKWERLRLEMETAIWNMRRPYLNQLYAQADLARWICRISPSESCAYGTQAMARTGVEAYRHFMRYVRAYSDSHREFMHSIRTKRGKRAELVAIQQEGYNKAIQTPPVDFSTSLLIAAPDICLLIILNVVFFMLSVLFFIRYDAH